MPAHTTMKINKTTIQIILQFAVFNVTRIELKLPIITENLSEKKIEPELPVFEIIVEEGFGLYTK